MYKVCVYTWAVMITQCDCTELCGRSNSCNLISRRNDHYVERLYALCPDPDSLQFKKKKKFKKERLFQLTGDLT